MITIESLQAILDKHWKEAFITCPETCWCWELETLIMHEEKKRGELMQNCENCKHEFELKKEEKISFAEFNGKTYSIPEKRWPLVEKNLSYYSLFVE